MAGLTRRSTVALPITAAWASAARSDAYPSRPLRWIVPYAPGGTSDFVARLVGQRVSEVLGQQVIVDNRPGATGIVATDAVAKASPDGYTFLLSDSTLALVTSLYQSLPFDVSRDLVPVGLLSSTPHAVVTQPGSPFRDLGALVAAARTDPGKLTYGSGGIGSPLHLAGVLLERAAGVRLTHVPFRGAGPAMAALLSKVVDVVLPSLPAAFGQITGGEVRALAVATETRWRLLPDVPSAAEAGVPGWAMSGWWGLHAPRGIGPDVVGRMQEALRSAVSGRALAEQFERQGAELTAGSPESYGQLVASETERWREVVKSAGITLG